MHRGCYSLQKNRVTRGLSPALGEILCNFLDKGAASPGYFLGIEQKLVDTAQLIIRNCHARTRFRKVDAHIFLSYFCLDSQVAYD